MDLANIATIEIGHTISVAIISTLITADLSRAVVTHW